MPSRPGACQLTPQLKRPGCVAQLASPLTVPSARTQARGAGRREAPSRSECPRPPRSSEVPERSGQRREGGPRARGGRGIASRLRRGAFIRAAPGGARGGVSGCSGPWPGDAEPGADSRSHRDPPHLRRGAMSEPSRDAHPVPHGSKACRRLFGPVDSEQLRRDCDALMAGCVQEARERWNFDFVTETPLEGDFAWERVGGLGLPKLYLPAGPRGGRDDLGGGRRPSASPALLQGTAQEDHLDLSLSCTLLPHPPERPEGSPGAPGTSQGRKRRQTSMTDFYHSKRRLIFSKRKP